MEDIIKELARSTTEIGELLGANASVLFLKPSIDEWSVLECITHLWLVEDSILRTVLSGGDIVDGPSQTWEAGKLKHILVNKREHKFDAPSLFVPRNEFLDAFVAFEHLKVVRNEFLRLLTENSSVFDGQLFPHPRLGMMTRLDWLWFAVAHSDRHLLQMRDTVLVLPNM